MVERRNAARWGDRLNTLALALSTVCVFVVFDKFQATLASTDTAALELPRFKALSPLSTPRWPSPSVGRLRAN